MSRRGGFTLLEVMVAIVLTSVVALVTFGTIQAAFALDERLDDHRGRAEAQMILRTFLVDALRHPPEEGGSAMNEMLFELGDRSDARGFPLDEIRFLSRGITPPLGASGSWAVTLGAEDGGVRLRAAPVGTSAAAPIEAWIGGARGLNVRVLYRTGDLEWSERWDVSGRVPVAVELAFINEAGAPASPPLVVHAGLENIR